MAVPNVSASGFGLNGAFSSSDGLAAAFLLKDGMPAVPREDIGPGLGAVKPPAAPRTALNFFQKNHVNGYAQQWNLTLQKELKGNLLLEAAYIANAGHKLGGPNVDINQVPLVNGRGPDKQDQQKRPFPQFNGVTQVSPPWGNSNYQSINFKTEKRYSGGLNFLMNFTWAKFLDDVQAGNELGGNEGNGYTHLALRKLDKSYSGSDIRLRYVAARCVPGYMSTIAITSATKIKTTPTMPGSTVPGCTKNSLMTSARPTTKTITHSMPDSPATKPPRK